MPSTNATYIHTSVWHTQGLLSPFLRPRPIHACAHGRYPTRARVSSDASCLWARQTACKFAHELQLVLRRGCGLSFAEQYGMRAGHTTHTPAISHRQSETPSANSRARAMYSMCVMSRAASPSPPHPSHFCPFPAIAKERRTRSIWHHRQTRDF